MTAALILLGVITHAIAYQLGVAVTIRHVNRMLDDAEKGIAP